MALRGGPIPAGVVDRHGRQLQAGNEVRVIAGDDIGRVATATGSGQSDYALLLHVDGKLLGQFRADGVELALQPGDDGYNPRVEIAGWPIKFHEMAEHHDEPRPKACRLEFLLVLAGAIVWAELMRCEQFGVSVALKVTHPRAVWRGEGKVSVDGHQQRITWTGEMDRSEVTWDCGCVGRPRGEGEHAEVLSACGKPDCQSPSRLPPRRNCVACGLLMSGCLQTMVRPVRMPDGQVLSLTPICGECGVNAATDVELQRAVVKMVRGQLACTHEIEACEGQCQKCGLRRSAMQSREAWTAAMQENLTAWDAALAKHYLAINGRRVDLLDAPTVSADQSSWSVSAKAKAAPWIEQLAIEREPDVHLAMFTHRGDRCEREYDGRGRIDRFSGKGEILEFVWVGQFSHQRQGHPVRGIERDTEPAPPPTEIDDRVVDAIAYATGQSPGTVRAQLRGLLDPPYLLRQPDPSKAPILGGRPGGGRGVALWLVELLRADPRGQSLVESRAREALHPAWFDGLVFPPPERSFKQFRAMVRDIDAQMSELLLGQSSGTRTRVERDDELRERLSDHVRSMYRAGPRRVPPLDDIERASNTELDALAARYGMARNRLEEQDSAPPKELTPRFKVGDMVRVTDADSCFAGVVGVVVDMDVGCAGELTLRRRENSLRYGRYGRDSAGVPIHVMADHCELPQLATGGPETGITPAGITLDSCDACMGTGRRIVGRFPMPCPKCGVPSGTHITLGPQCKLCKKSCAADGRCVHCAEHRAHTWQQAPPLAALVDLVVGEQVKLGGYDTEESRRAAGSWIRESLVALDRLVERINLVAKLRPRRLECDIFELWA